MGGEKEVVWNGGGSETVLNNIFKNGFIFLKCTDCRNLFSKIVLIVRIFSKIVRIFSKNVRIVPISSENVRIFVPIFSKKFWPPWISDGRWEGM